MSSSSFRSSSVSVSDNSFRLNFDELRWVMEIRKTLEEEHEEEGEFTVSIFNVPKLLMVCDPDSYVPQQVAIGPYHYWRPELYEMQRYKLAAARRFRKHHLQNHHKFEDLVHQMTKLEPRIRASYHKYLDFNGETLVWMMIIDASFLLEFLQVYAIQEGNKIPGISSRMSHLVDYAGKKSAHNAILRDIVMLENQIPLCVLRKMLEFKFSSLDDADHFLSLMLIGLFNELSPFKMMQDYPDVQISESAHLLDFFYDMIVPRTNNDQQPDLVIQVDEFIESKGGNNGEESNANSSYLKKFLREVWKILSKLNRGPAKLIKKVLLSRPLKVFVKLPWTIISNLPGVKLIKKPVEYYFNFTQEEKPENGSASNSLIEKPPLIEEITIPSVTELMKSGVRFVPTNGSVSGIKFDPKTRTLHLPKVGLDVNTEVFLRNLVAFEASVASGPLVLTRYTELMNGIVDGDEDAKVLRERGVILNHLKSDEEVADLWNGMSKSIKLTKVPSLDKVVEDVNKYYDGRLKVKAWKFMRSYIFGSWQFLTFLAAICLLLLMILQAFCSVYTCNRYFQMAVSH
ncbi:putative UPF0481 protein At3g02645 [Prosopis cineraria]|uniref:putative UPF0481 protein At3g02645 n=1 Tax=Prosopis cineraria TaxID=364024 RepID=UPI00240F123C|nr:putative UPF0481 protein At3g02645 [Prosopis cineraria]